MSPILIILIGILFLVLVLAGVGLKILFGAPVDNRLQVLSNKAGTLQGDMSLKSGRTSGRAALKKEDFSDQTKGRATGSIIGKDKEVVYFQAGIFSNAQKSAFQKRCSALSLVFIVVLTFVAFAAKGLIFAPLGALTGLMIGRIYPDKVLSKKIANRQEDFSYYLPLVIEQLSIGVSSGLDIGPCLASVVDMANERGANNAVTEVVSHAMSLSKAGMSLEESLLEVGAICGYTPVKNSFTFLAQCSRHGGEISKQLMELSEAVSAERQNFIESKINALPNKATLVLGMIFGGSFIVLLSGIFVNVLSAFKG